MKLSERDSTAWDFMDQCIDEEGDKIDAFFKVNEALEEQGMEPFETYEDWLQACGRYHRWYAGWLRGLIAAARKN